MSGRRMSSINNANSIIQILNPHSSLPKLKTSKILITNPNMDTPSNPKKIFKPYFARLILSSVFCFITVISGDKESDTSTWLLRAS
jgi:hypothetical protein